MKTKHLFLTAILLVFSMLVVAEPVDPMRALEVAEQFAPQSAKTKRIKSKTTPEQSYEIVYTHRMPNSDRAAFYVVKLGEKGFVIISADDVANPILGYSYTNSWPTSISAEGDTLLPPQVLSYLNDMALQIETAIEKYPNLESSEEWNNVGQKAVRKSRARKSANALPDSVGPLLTTTWGQGQYYNALCPEDAEGEDGHVPTGCVATAMAQIINYWGQKEDIKTRGIHSYDSQYGNLTVNYDSTSYDFANMPDALTAESTPEQINAVAKLMYECGVAVNMQYSAGASGTHGIMPRVSLVNNFNFSSTTSYFCKRGYKHSDFERIIKEQITLAQPILYNSIDTILNVGHAFICDGYNQNEYFHFNFGWDGNGDGWYRLTSICPGIYNLDNNVAIVVNIKPTQNESILYDHFQGKSTYTINYPTTLYSGLENSFYRGIVEDYYNYGDTIVLFPSTPDGELELSINRLPNMSSFINYIYIYDGTSTDSLLRVVSDIDDIIDMSPIVSTNGALCVYLNGVYGYDGFSFDVYEHNGCQRVNDVKATRSSDEIIVDWKENGEANKWEVEYGLSGFYIGMGTKIVVQDTPTVKLKNLEPLKQYDVYVRSICDENAAGMWSNKVSFRSYGEYWIDQVTSQPNGYIVDPNGDVLISTAEGLAWFSKLSQTDNFAGKTVRLCNNINLSDFEWTSISSFYGTFDGQGHIIENLISGEDGLFGHISGEFGSIINDTHLRNVFVERSNGSLGALVGYVTDGARIINCSSTGILKANKDVIGSGGVVGELAKGEIVNCWSSCIIDGANSYSVGGICGTAQKGSRVKNCFWYGFSVTKDVKGAVVGYSEYCDVEKCYAAFENYSLVAYGGLGTTYTDLEWFTREDTIFKVFNPIAFETDTTNVLIDILNLGVLEMNDSTLRTWIIDPDNDMPVFGHKLEVTCPNISNLTVKNILNDRDEIGVVITWEEDGDATQWEIQYQEQDSINSTRLLTINNPDTIWMLKSQTPYIFQIRPICDENNYGGWGEKTLHIVDRPYWKEIVTARPQGYVTDSEGNVTISSAEGLAWFMSVVNGFNGELPHDFYGKRITLIQDIDIQQYRWTPINNFLGTFDGKNYSIKNLYIHDLIDTCGLFGNITGGIYLNITINNANIKGNEFVGGLMGYVQDATILNCHTSGLLCGESYVGGIAGSGLRCTINQCSSIGIIQANKHYAGGLLGSMNGDIIRNSYTRSDVIVDGYGCGGLTGPCSSGIIENSYSIGNIYGFMYCGGLLGTLRSDSFTPSSVKNCYTNCSLVAFGEDVALEGSNSGIIIGTTDGEMYIQNCYGSHNQKFPLIGPAEYSYDNGVPLLQDTTRFILSEGNIIFKNSIEIDGIFYTHLIGALNAWVDDNNSEGQYSYWLADTASINDGFPILAENESKYIITFCNEDGTILQQDTLELGEMPEYRGDTPIKEFGNAKYSFSGWSSKLRPATENITYTAQYTEMYEVTFYNWDGTLLQSAWYNYGEYPSYNGETPTHEADAQYTYTFSGWSPRLDWISGHQSYYAQYETTLNQYEINFYDWDGTLLQSEWVNYGEWPNYYNSDPWREADAQYTYTFTGWSPELSMVTGTTYYYAQYETTLNQYEINFYDWDGTLLQSSMVNYGEWPTYYNSDPWRAADAQYTYTFIGWSPQLDWVTGNQSYYAQYEATLNQYEITFYDWDGTLLHSSMVNYGEWPMYYNSDPWREADAQYTYTFIGWSPELDWVTGTASYYAQYEATLNQYEVTFLNWDGSVLQSTMVNYGEMPSYTGITPTREADAQYTYTFSGWSPQLDWVSGNQAYYAQYESTINQYEITFYDWDGTLLQSNMVNYGEWPMYYNSDPWREADAQYTYTFTGWSPQLDMVTGHQYYYAQYASTLNQYEINFYDWDGTLLQSNMVNYGEWPNYYNSDPWREADAQYTYTFTGWSPQLDMVTGHQYYYAQYTSTLNQYEINFYDWDGTLLQSSMVNYGEWPNYYNSDPWREADAQYTYTFTGWSPQLDMVTGHQYYYAQYTSTLNQYEINFYDWDGTLLQSSMVNYGEWPNYYNSDPWREADAQYTYTFTGWSPELSMVTGTTYYYAQYESTLNQYEITFYDWDGTLLHSAWHYYGDYPNYGGPALWREADAQYTYNFTGWSPELSMVTGTTYYYAQYETTLNQYEINFYDWDGTLLQSNMVNYGEWPNYYNSDPWREADAQYTYTFTGWSPQLDMVTGHQSYYAQYEETLNQYEINFYDWDGTLLQSSMLNYGEMPEYLGATPTKPEDEQYIYTFLGWEPEITLVIDNATYSAVYEAIEKVGSFTENITTDIIKPRKVYIQGNLYIIIGDHIYSCQGHRIK